MSSRVIHGLSAGLILLALAASALAGERTAPTVYPMAVLPLDERGSEVKGYGAKVTDLLFINLVVKDGLFLVDREDLKSVLDELKLSASGMVQPDGATAVGQLTGAKILVTGSVIQVDRSIYLVAKIIGTETSRVLGASAKGNVGDELAPLVEQLADEVAKTVTSQAGELVAKPVTRSDRLAALKKKLADRKLPTVWVSIQERHIGPPVIDPAAETEVTLMLTECGFTLIDRTTGVKGQADVIVQGEGISELAGRVGDFVSVKARLEVKAIDQSTGKVLAVDRQTAVAVDLTEQLAGKAALQQAAAEIAERLLPKIAQGEAN